MSGRVVEMQIGNDAIDLTKIVMLYERRKTGAAPPAISSSVLAARGWNKTSCTVLHVGSIKCKSAMARRGRLLFSRSGGASEAESRHR